MISRAVIALSVSLVFASVADAKNLCLRFPSGQFGGSQLVLKKGKFSPRSFGLLQGYFARYSFTSESFGFWPIQGSSIATAHGEVGLAIQVPHVQVGGTGQLLGLDAHIFIMNLWCSPGSDGILGLLDTCGGVSLLDSNDEYSTLAQIISCSDAVAIPTE